MSSFSRNSSIINMKLRISQSFPISILIMSHGISGPKTKFHNFLVIPHNNMISEYHNRPPQCLYYVTWNCGAKGYFPTKVEN